jgi:hypothetical protein
MEDTIAKLEPILVMFLVLSVVFETALTPIFNWTVFCKNFEGKGVKTPITVIAALVIFWGYDLDILNDILWAFGRSESQTATSFSGEFISALLIAGGSDGIFRIFTRLGIRNPMEREKKAEAARAASPGSPVP